MNENKNAGLIRIVLYTEEFKEFYLSLNDKTQNKIDYVINLIKNFRLVHTDFVKKLVDTEFYEMRISLGNNEYRTILFSIDHDNIIEAKEIILLNGFLKKSTKDYAKQIKIAAEIIKNIEL